MSEPTIKCPNCKSEIKLTESLATPIVESVRQQYEKKIADRESEFLMKEGALRDQKEALDKAGKTIEERVNSKVKMERENIAREEAKKARFELSIDFEKSTREISELKEVLGKRDAQLLESQNAQAALIRKQRELDDAKREMELTIETRVQESLLKVRDQAKKEAESGLKLKVIEKEQTILSMQQQIDELKRRSEQGSQQLQGEAQELELENHLRCKFPKDLLEPVPKGEFGGDILHRVIGPSGLCGTILWEAKRTKNWSDAWLAKLRGDQRSAKAEIAVIASQTLPKGVESFDLIDGVWVVDSRCAIAVATVLRHSLIELAGAHHVREGQQTKMELVYQYLTSVRFRQRIQAIVEKFSDMNEDLDRERKTMTRLWAKREEQIRGVIEATAGMYGDLQGIAGKTLQEIDGLNLKQLEDTQLDI